MTKSRMFVAVPAAATILFTAFIASLINWANSNIFLEVTWLSIMTLLNYNLFLISFAALFSFFSGKDKMLSQEEAENYKAALLFSLKNEESVYEKLRINVQNNLSALSEVVITSNSDKPQAVEEEKLALIKIQNEFGIQATHFPARPPKHMGIYDFFNSRTNIKYVATADADSIFPEGSILKLLRKAAHPDNKDVAIWQSHSIAIEGKTRFSKIMSAGQNICARLYAQGFYNALGQSGYYGSGALVDRQAFSDAGNMVLNNGIIPPESIKSHDVWEATLLPKIGKQVKYSGDVITFEDFPISYIDMIDRDRRWMKGTLQSFKSLFIQPEKNTIATYFYVLNPIAMYLIQPLYLVWVGLGIARFFYTDMNSTDVQVLATLFTLSLLFCQKFLAARSFQDLNAILKEQVFSTLFYINTPMFTTLNILLLGVKEEWIPMAKKVRYKKLTTVINKFMLNEIIGYWGVLFIAFNIDPVALFFFPIFIMFMLSGVISYYFQFSAHEEDKSGPSLRSTATT